MNTYDKLDLLFLIVLGFANFIYYEGPIELILFLCGLLPHAFVIDPLRVVYTRHIEMYGLRPKYARHVSCFELWVSRQLRWVLANVNPDLLNRTLFSSQTWIALYQFRRFRYGVRDIGDAEFKHRNYSNFDGYWVKSRTCGSDYDLVVMFVPGCVGGAISPYVYLEFTTVLLNQLRERGFRSPGIFVLNTKFRKQNYKQSLDTIQMCWGTIAEEFSQSTKVVMGSGLGATSVLNMMLHAAKPLTGLSNHNYVKPDAVLLISPMAKLAKTRADGDCDFITDKSLAKSAVKLLDILDTTEIWAMPGELRDRQWWYRALPELGIHITYGEEEILAPEINEMMQNLKGCKHLITSLKKPNQLHAWPIANYFLGRTKVMHYEGVNLLALRLAEMTLWHTVAESQPTTTSSPLVK